MASSRLKLCSIWKLWGLWKRYQKNIYQIGQWMTYGCDKERLPIACENVIYLSVNVYHSYLTLFFWFIHLSYIKWSEVENLFQNDVSKFTTRIANVLFLPLFHIRKINQILQFADSRISIALRTTLFNGTSIYLRLLI